MNHGGPCFLHDPICRWLPFADSLDLDDLSSIFNYRIDFFLYCGFWNHYGRSLETKSAKGTLKGTNGFGQPEAVVIIFSRRSFPLALALPAMLELEDWHLGSRVH